MIEVEEASIPFDLRILTAFLGGLIDSCSASLAPRILGTGQRNAAVRVVACS